MCVRAWVATSVCSSGAGVVLLYRNRLCTSGGSRVWKRFRLMVGRSGADAHTSGAPAVPRGDRSPLRSAGALVLNGGVTSGLGLVYWLLAARLYPIADVGRNASLVAALVVLSAISQLNYGRSLAVLLPAAGGGARTVLLGAYRRSSALALLVGLAYVLVAPRAGSGLAYLRDDWLPLILPVSVALWVVFSLQDAALTSLNAAYVVPVQNFAFGVAKLVLLVVFWRMHLFSIGIFASWVLPLLVCVPAVTVIMWRRFMPVVGSPSTGPAVTGSRSSWFWLDVAGYYVYLFGTAPLSVVVLTVLGPVAAAAFYLPSTVASTVERLAFAVGNVLTADLTRHHGIPYAGSRRLVRLTLLVVAVLAVACVVAGPLLIALVGKEYQRGAVVLVCFLVAALPRTMLVLQIATLRAQRRGGAILTVQVVVVVATIVAMLSFVPSLGLNGVGVGWLVGSLVGALAAIATRWGGGASGNVAPATTSS
jgi:O-antigen/teichoic acid export membrane protein